MVMVMATMVMVMVRVRVSFRVTNRVRAITRGAPPKH